MTPLQIARCRIIELEDILRPFAREAKEWGKDLHDTTIPQIAGYDEMPVDAKFTLGDLRRAAAAIGAGI